MQLMHWEWTELEEHLVDRSDIWVKSPSKPGLWFRLCGGPDPAFAMLATPSAPSRYATVSISVAGMVWAQETADAYVDELAVKWTSLGTRRQFSAFLGSELHIEPETAHLASIELARMLAQADEPDPDALPEQLDLEGVSDLPGCTRIGLYPHVGGGYTALHLSGDRLRVHLSVRTAEAYGGGYNRLLQGFLFPPSNCTVRQLAAFLTGAPLTFPELSDEEKAAMLQEAQCESSSTPTESTTSTPPTSEESPTSTSTSPDSSATWTAPGSSDGSTESA